MQLEPAAVESLDGIGGPMRLVEHVSGKRPQFPPDNIDFPLRSPPAQGTGPENRLQLIHRLAVGFLDQNPPKQICRAEIHPGEAVGHQQDMLLVYQQTITVSQHLLKDRMQVDRFLQTQITTGKTRLLVLVGRTGTDHGNSRHQAVNVPTAAQLEETGHRRGFYVKHAPGLPHSYHLVNPRIGIIHLPEGILRTGILPRKQASALPLSPEVGKTIPEHAQARLPQQIHFEQPQILDGLHRQLRHRESPGTPDHRREITQGAVGNDHPTGVHHRMARQSVQIHRLADRLREPLIRPETPGRDVVLTARKKLPERPVGKPLAPAMRLLGRYAHRLGHFRHRSPALEAREAPDHRHLLPPVSLVQPNHDFLPPVPWQVQVNVRQLALPDPLPVQKPFKTQIKPEGTDISHPQGMANQAPGRTPPRQNRNVPAPTLLHHLPENQEITRISGFLDYFQLPPQALQQCSVIRLTPPGIIRSIPLHDPPQTAPGQKTVLMRPATRLLRFLRTPTNQWVRQEQATVNKIEGTGFRKGPGLLQNLRHPRKPLRQLLRGHQPIVTFR